MNVGIDLGTSYSSICIINKEGKPEPVHVSTGLSIWGDNYSLPSAVFAENGKLIVGQAAMVSRMKNLENFKSGFKRDLGQDIPYSLGDMKLMPQDLYRELFIHLKKCAEEYAGEPVDLACITHPANYNSRKKELIINAAKKAGILNVVLIDEPTAAALYYCNDKKLDDGDKLLVYDFGGGTFDVALIEYQKGKFESLTPPIGVEHCGGIDIDRMIFDDLINRIPTGKISELKVNPVNLKRFRAKLNETSVKAKHHLSAADQYAEDIEIGFDYVNYEISRKRFNSMIGNLIEETMTCAGQIVRNAGMKFSEVDVLLLVGGTSRVPLVRERLELIADKNLQANLNPELAVSMGAALFANRPNGEPKETKPVFCIQCGNKISTADRFCIKCGRPNVSYMSR
ncbi:MAG: Hsp70 family protein [Mangrovibacterium sp.]